MKKIDINIFKEDILNTIREPVLVLDSDLKVIYVNNSFYDKFKLTPDEVENKYVYELGNGEWDIPELRKLLEEIMHNKTTFHDFKFQHVFSNIGQRTMLITAKELDGGRDEKFIVATLEDVTEKTKLMEASLQANKLAVIGQLSSGIAHGLSSPLTGIYNFLDAYFREEPEGTIRRHELKLMLEACTYMNNIVKNLSLFARTTKDEFKKISLADVIDSTLSFTERQFIASNIFFTKDIPDEIKKIKGNKSQLQHVLLNILMNSKEAITDRGEIIIKARNSDNSVILEITDNGKGIPKQYLQHLFEPFFTTKNQKGTGLGLSVAYGIVKNHHGEIKVESEEGKGTRVIITLPFAE
jgi:two-component system CheB/CheR fusion protein